jgi:uncharacterized glyoxalase superfamily protein PhnB
MNDVAHVAAGRSSPGLRYRDVGAAIKWLCSTFGFQVRSSVTGDDGRVTYAELSFGSTIIMVGAVSGFDIDGFMAQPDDIGGAETQCCYYVVDDIDAHYVRARRARCEIVIDLQTRPNGTRAFTCRDLEGHLWCFGTYDPYTTAADRAASAAKGKALPVAIAAVAHRPAAKFPGHFPGRLAAGLSMAAIVSGIVAVWTYGEAWQSSREAGAAPAALIGPERMLGTELAGPTFQRAIKDARRRLAFERKSRRAAEQASRLAQAQAAQERSLRISAEQTAKQLADQLAHAQQAADQAQSAASTAQDKLAKERAKQLANGKLNANVRLTREVEEAQRAAANARAELARAETAKAAAEREAKETRARLTFVSLSAKKDSEQAIAEIRKQMLDEQTAREEAEREARYARNELASERSLKQAALRNVELLKRRLAAAGIQVTTGQSALKKVVARRRAQAVPKPVAAAAPTRAAEKGWSLYGGPVFVKDTGAP